MRAALESTTNTNKHNLCLTLNTRTNHAYTRFLQHGLLEVCDQRSAVGCLRLYPRALRRRHSRWQQSRGLGDRALKVGRHFASEKDFLKAQFHKTNRQTDCYTPQYSFHQLSCGFFLRVFLPDKQQQQDGRKKYNHDLWSENAWPVEEKPATRVLAGVIPVIACRCVRCRYVADGRRG